jgi:hypothetical protein
MSDFLSAAIRHLENKTEPVDDFLVFDNTHRPAAEMTYAHVLWNGTPFLSGPLVFRGTNQDVLRFINETPGGYTYFHVEALTQSFTLKPVNFNDEQAHPLPNPAE